MNLTQLLREAQFHGASRLADRRHRFWWAIALFLSFSAATCVILNTTFRYFQNPTYLSLLPEDVDLPFPSVQICPEIFFPTYKIEKFVSEINIPSGYNATKIKRKLRQLAAFYSPDIMYKDKDLVMLQSVLDYNKLTVLKVTERLTASCEETLIKCRWLGDMVNCSEIFQMHMTAVGYCCVFNGRSLIQEIKEYGLHKIEPRPQIITKEVGPNSGLMIVVNQSQEQTNVDLSYKWITLDNGQDYVDFAKNGTVALSPGKESWAAFGYQRLKIADDARNLSPDLRRCRFYNEPLKYFPVYKKNYCLVECEMKRTFDLCQCLLTVHPRPPGTALCRASGLPCAKRAVSYGTDQCECPDTCDTDSDFYNLQSFKLLNDSFYFDRFYENLDYKKVTVVRVFLHSRRSKVSARRSLFNYITLYSQLGGILNVYFGCSILTVLEITQLLWRAIHKHCTSKAKVKITERIPPVQAKVTDSKALALPPVEVEVKETKGLILPPLKVKTTDSRDLQKTVANKRKFKRNKKIVEVKKNKPKAK